MNPTPIYSGIDVGFDAMHGGPKTPLTCTIKQPGCVHVVQCGHKFDPRGEPKGRCGFCWHVHFSLHPAEIPAGQSIIKVYGKEAIIKSRGEKYYKALRKAIEAYEWKQNQEQLVSQMDMPESQVPQALLDSSLNLAPAKSDGLSASSTTLTTS